MKLADKMRKNTLLAILSSPDKTGLSFTIGDGKTYYGSPLLLADNDDNEQVYNIFRINTYSVLAKQKMMNTISFAASIFDQRVTLLECDEHMVIHFKTRSGTQMLIHVPTDMFKTKRFAHWFTKANEL